ncbi:PsbP-related protein [Novispirillum itersonii]|uniref:PsbP-related protein n=1 Tax=Novispirillum itersonii TaxID=189 RepID=UPI00037825F1|nr:PsbP-related protein [Novispirillum itersonii]
MIRRLSGPLPAATLLLALATAAPAAVAAPFADPSYGYTLTYPDGWRMEKAEGYTLIFRPPAGEAEEVTSVSIQNRKAPEPPAKAEKADKGKKDAKPAPTPSGTAAQEMATRYVTEIRGAAQSVVIQREAPFRWENEDSVILGRQAVVDFMLDGVPLRQWAVFLPNPAAPVMHVWIMTAPQDTFDRTLPDARKILDTLKAATPAKKPEQNKGKPAK